MRLGTGVALFGVMEKIPLYSPQYPELKCQAPGCPRAKHRELKYCVQHAAGLRRRLREQVLRDCGMTKVRGAQGGTYWE